LIRSGPEHRYTIFGIVESASGDSATVSTRNGCIGIQQQTISYSQLMVRIPAGRMTIPYAMGGAINAFMFGKIAAHIVFHNGGGAEGAKAVRYGAALSTAPMRALPWATAARQQSLEGPRRPRMQLPARRRRAR
jgi:hypothetical protein